jgi:hypothetical protein
MQLHFMFILILVLITIVFDGIIILNIAIILHLKVLIYYVSQ